jgi:hypothetical protein
MKLGVVVHVCSLDTKEVGEGRTPVKAHPGLQILSQKNQNQNQEKKKKKKKKGRTCKHTLLSILYKGLEHLWMLASMWGGSPEQIPCGCGTTVYINLK